MTLKSTCAAIAAATALTGAVFLAGAAQATPCIYQQGGTPESTPLTNPTSDPTTTQAELGDFNLNKLGMVAASVAVLGGLFAGVLLKRRLDRKSEPLIEKEIQTEVLSNDLPNPGSAAADFTIEIPQAVIQSIRETENSESELSSVR